MEELRVRFAPSPTGFLHVGGARTAIFNWLFVRNHKGRFLLRIEDTDPQRSRSELSEQIIRSLKWLGMEPDEPVVYQSDRMERFKEVIGILVKERKAYYCFETTEELEQKRNEAKKKKIAYKYDRAALKLDQQTVQKYLDERKEHTVRFFVPEGTTGFDDIIHGKTVFKNSEIDDFVILRSDGSPVYQIAVVVDDHDMRITHVIRGDDHLSNTPKQVLLYQALGWDIPEFAHLPMILDEEKKKLSKRRNTVSVEEYQKLGYLPDALFNFLTLLGFAPENNREILPREEFVNIFTFDRVNKKSAVFDMKKLAWINSEYIKNLAISALDILIREKLEQLNVLSWNEIQKIPAQYTAGIINLMKERVSTINDFITLGKYFFIEPDSYDEKGIAKYWNEETKRIMIDYYDSLKSSPPEFNALTLEEHLRRFAEESNTKAATLIHPLRLALTGMTISPGIFELMAVLGKDVTTKRLDRFISS
jgi:glutamyl-tRNA synthetase